VSTEDQTTANQLEQLREMAARRGWTVVTEHVVTGSAWTGKHRATLDDALRGARLGEFDVLLVWSLDRISREGVEATLGILRKFRQHGVPVISRQEPWTDTADPHLAELLSSIFAWMAGAASGSGPGSRARRLPANTSVARKVRRISSRVVALATSPGGSTSGRRAPRSRSAPSSPGCGGLAIDARRGSRHTRIPPWRSEGV
jgi:hypothetical protein